MADTTTLFEPTVSKSLAHGNFQPDASAQIATSRTQHESRELAQTPNESMIQVIARAASNPSIDLDKMERLINLQVKLMEMEAVRAFNTDIASMQDRIMPVVKRGEAAFNTKNGGRTEYSFARYADIDAMVKPVLSEYGFSLSFSLDGRMYHGKLSHKMGHSISTSIQLPIDDSGSKNAIQAQGSTITYAMRYLTCMMLNIATQDGDNDGHSYGVETITRSQFEELEFLLADSGADRGKFLKLMDVPSVDLIPAVNFNAAKQALKSYQTGTPVSLNLKKKV